MIKIEKMKVTWSYQVQNVILKIINFMAKHGRGLICLALTKKQIEKLKFPLMSQLINQECKQPLRFQ